MTAAEVLYDPAFPHGTPEGFRGGCRGAHCPAAMSCRDVSRRAAGDWRFQAQLAKGVPLEEILAAERAAEAALIAEERRERAEERRRCRQSARTLAPTRTVTQVSEMHRAVRSLHGQGLTDLQIGERIGKTRIQVRSVRRYLGLPINAVEFDLPDQVRALHGEGLMDTEIAARLGRDRGHVSRVRRTLKLPRNVHYNVNPDRVAELHATGLTDTQIGAKLRVDRSVIAKYRRRLELAPNPRRS